MGVDFRESNKIVAPEPQPFSQIEHMVVNASNCNYFTALDINSAFWAIPIRIKDCKNTIFVTQKCH